MINLKLSPRLNCIASMIENDSHIIDIGCDHGLLDIYLTIFKNCQCIASDISLNVLKNTNINLKKYDLLDKVTVIQSNGLENIVVDKFSIIIISGMGTSTILEILENAQTININNLIVQSNNELDILRKEICKKVFYIYDEKIISDNGKDYVIIYFKKGTCSYSKVDYLFGPIARKQIENNFYYEKMYQKNKSILKKIPFKHIVKKIKLMAYLKQIKKFTCINKS